MTKFILNIASAALIGCALLAGCGSMGNAKKDEKWKTVSVDGTPAAAALPSATGADVKHEGFAANLPPGFVQPSDETGRRLLKDYGAVFLARGGAAPPKTVIFRDESEVTAFQAEVSRSTESIGGVTISLQAAAMNALKDAAAEAKQNGLSITPRGSDAAARTYRDTVELWKSRVEPGLAHWTSAGKLPAPEAARIRSLSPYEQVPEILKLESAGLFFSKDLSKSIVYSVAPPGSSQHLSMLAVDINEYDNAKTRAIMAKHGWYQTVASDLPHFTFLGAPESELPRLGLKKTGDPGRVFWVPAL